MSDSPHNSHANDSMDNNRDNSPYPDEQGERLDSVPDMDQEKREDPRTLRKIDSLEDDTSEFSMHKEVGSQAHAERQAKLSDKSDELERLADRARQLQTPEADGSDDDWQHDSSPEMGMRETSDGVPDSIQEQELHRANIFTTPDELMPSAYYYRLVAVLPEYIVAMGQNALAAVEINEPMVGFQIEAAFMTEHIHRVNTVIMAWAKQYLPLPSLLLDVHSEVWGSQQYIAGWRLNHRTLWHQAQNELTTQLASISVPAPNSTATFRPYIALLEHAPADKFPYLIANLHANFIQEEFHVEAVDLLRKPRPEFERRVDTELRTWQLFQRFAMDESS